MDEDAYRRWADRAIAALGATMDAAKRDLRIGEFPRYDYDLRTRRFWWSEGGVPRVEATAIGVGTVSKTSGTWLWAWANPSWNDMASPEWDRLRAHGGEHEIPVLTTPEWEGDETDGWEMTAVAAAVLGWTVGYRSPGEVAGFILLKDLRVVG